MTPPRTGSGTVLRFDAAVGVGVVVTPDGAELGFHCTQIADGSRDITIGEAVEWTVLAGRGGRWEAGCVRPHGAPADRRRREHD